MNIQLFYDNCKLCYAVTPLLQQLRHYGSSYATTAAVTPLLQQLRHYGSSNATMAAVTPLWQQLRHYCSSYATTAAVTPLWQQLRHYCSSNATTAVTPLWQLRHYGSSYATMAAVTPLLQLRHSAPSIPAQAVLVKTQSCICSSIDSNCRLPPPKSLLYQHLYLLYLSFISMKWSNLLKPFVLSSRIFEN